MNRSQIVLLVVFSIIAGFVLINLRMISSRIPERSYSSFLTDLERGSIAEVTIKGGSITGIDSDGRKFSTFSPNPADILPRLIEHNVLVNTRSSPEYEKLLREILIVFLLIGGWWIMSRKKVRESIGFNAQELLLVTLRALRKHRKSSGK